MQDDIVSLALTSRTLFSKSQENVSIYKTESQKFVDINHVVKTTDHINTKIKNKTLQPTDMIMINILNTTITKGILQAENKITKNRFTHPWSPTLTVAILTLSLRKVKMTALRNNHEKSHVVTKLLHKIKEFPGQPIPVQTDSCESKLIHSNFQDAKKY